MSTLGETAKVLAHLEPEDWKVLHSMEGSLYSYEAVPLAHVAKMTGFDRDEVEYRLSRLNRMNFITKGEKGYLLVSAGLDAIALNAFVKRGLLSGLGKAIGMGKESDVFDAIDERGEEYAVKFYRIGRISFRATKRKRAYAPPTLHHHWLIVNMRAAKKEYDALRRLHPIGVSVPEAMARERHAVVMRKVEGMMLSECADLPSPKEVLKDVLDNIRLAYTKGDIVNSDLSEFNILYDGVRVCIIDWPQFVSKVHPNASALLDRDVANMLRFFKRKFNVDCKLESASFYVRGWSDGPTIL